MKHAPGRPRLVPRLTPAVTWIIGVEVGVFLVYLFAGAATRALMTRWLMLTPAAILDGEVWKLATTALFTPSGLAFFFDILMLGLFMPVLEKHWGTRRFLLFFAAATVVGNVASAGMGLLLGGAARAVPIAGLSPFVYAAIAAYGTAFADEHLQLFGAVPMRGRVLAIGVAAFVLLFVLLNGAWVEGAGYFAAMALGCVFAGGRLTPNIWLLRFRRWRLRRRVTVIDGGARPAPRKKQQWLN